ncbi:FAD-binding protein [Paenibacillus sacheonensis]|uniref:FAD-binding protein n=1 Tax=Paenibacillus sacheonensis TaxID=742054 RepID=A0A7X5C0I7_9BACL|nr:FAD-binding protein [Paenibacillus sacheonensis]MBM7564763.1 xylitol oxidase [Paenibacillus sacheonensis]NBC69315.1 FAD-binding protein [Paenibacillus sacheonensis]
MENNLNWAGNYRFGATELLVPETMEQLQEMVVRSTRMRVLGTRHSFNGIADSAGSQLSLQKLNCVVSLDRENGRVTVEAGIRYGELATYLHANGYALHNLASLPHITVAGACATATHGSGDSHGNLSTAVHALEIVQASGETVVFSRDQQDGLLEGAVVGLGGLGAVTKITLDVVPAFEMSQRVYENLPLAQLERHFDAIFSSGYSVSLFTDWKQSAFNQVWQKRQLAEDGNGASVQAEPDFFGAAPALEHRHPVPGHTAENCSEQLGIPGPWHERMPHFRMDFTPSAGKELQSEYFVPRSHAYEALRAINQLRERIAPLLYITEVRTIAADKLWMSPSFGQDSVGIHFTWKPDWENVRQVLPDIEAQLAPFGARPHWAKLFTMPPARVQSRYAKLPEFRRLLLQCDPEGKFRNDFLNAYIME